MKFPVGLPLTFFIAVFLGCSSSVRTVAPSEKFTGQALKADGSALANVCVLFQPTQDGYEIEMEADGNGLFSGEGIPGKYIFYFAPSMKRNAASIKGIPKEYLEPNMEHLVVVSAAKKVVCKVEIGDMAQR